MNQQQAAAFCIQVLNVSQRSNNLRHTVGWQTDRECGR